MFFFVGLRNTRIYIMNSIDFSILTWKHGTFYEYVRTNCTEFIRITAGVVQFMAQRQVRERELTYLRYLCENTTTHFYVQCTLDVRGCRVISYCRCRFTAGQPIRLVQCLMRFPDQKNDGTSLCNNRADVIEIILQYIFPPIRPNIDMPKNGASCFYRCQIHPSSLLNFDSPR